MNHVIFIAPFVKERYKGGIMRIAEFLSENASIELFQNNNIEVEFFNSHVLMQSKNSEGKISLENIKQAFYLLFRLAKRVRKNDFDAIHFNSSSGFPLFKDQVIIFIISILTSKNIYFQIHFSGVEETFSKSWLIRKLHLFFLKRNFKIILLSENFKNQLITLGFAESKLCVLYNFHNVNANPKLDLKKSDQVLELLFIGSICKRKGFHDLLTALSQIGIEYRLNVLGEFSDNDMKSHSESYILEHHLNVSFYGYLAGPDKDAVISKSDILILPSYSEGFPMVIPEAMAMGCAIISTDIAGIPEIVIQGINGFLINPGDIKELTNKITRLSNDRELLINFKKNSLKLSSQYTLENYIGRLSEIYNN